MPGFAFGEFSGGGKAGEFGAGAGAAGRAVVGFARAENEVLAVGLDAVGGGIEGFDVIDQASVCSGDLLILEGLTDGGCEGSEFVEMIEADRWPLISDEEKPIAAPSDVAGDGAVAGNVDRLVFSEAIGRHVGYSDGSVGRECRSDDANRSFNAVIAGFNLSEVFQSFDEANGAMETAVEAGDVVEENDSGDA